MSRSISRRRFVLRSLAGGMAIPFLPSLAAAETGKDAAVLTARGAGADAERFVAVGNLLGFQTERLFPKTAGDGFETTELLKPLEANRGNLTVYRGFDHGLRGGHFAVHTFLSGVLHHESKLRPDANVTIDQFIADEVGTQTRFPSLTVGSEGGIHGGCQMSWTKSGVRVPPITGPAELFRTLFVGDSADTRKQRAAANALQASILDSVRGEAGSLARRVNSEDRAKLDEYLTAVRDVEKRLDNRRRWTDRPKPDAPFEAPADTNFVDDLPMLYELVALALQTDSTRVATLEVGGSFLPQSLGIKKSYHSLSHHGNDQKAVKDLVTLETYQVEQFNTFLSRLAGIADGQRSLLDSTAVLFGSGMGDANHHKNTDLPVILAGGGFATGQFRTVESKGLNKVPLCNLLLGVAHRMGVPAESFGNSTGVFAA